MAAVLDGPSPLLRPAVSLDMAFVVNLSRRGDRWERFSQHLTQDLCWDIPLVRSAAVDTSHWQNDAGTARYNSFLPYVDPAAMPPIVTGLRTAPPDLSRGAVGCTLSHLQLWSTLLAHESWESMLIFEDDALWMHPLKLPLAEITARVNALPRDWDMLLLGGYPKESLGIYEHHYHVGFFHCTHAYIVHRQAVTRLMRNMLPLRMQLDSALSKKVAEDNLRIYCLKDRLFDQTWRDTDIQIPFSAPPTRDY